jgi:putative heme-binding domain-containing protein
MTNKLFTALAATMISSTCFAADEHDPATERASFQIAAGFDVSLFASEKEGVVKPIQMRFDPQGRIWVIGSSVYPQLEPGQVPNDKVLVLEDTDHDGQCDKVTVFADGLMIPTGIELGDGGVYVGQGTELLFFKDNDGDLKADERRVVLRGFGTGDNHQNINSFLWGPGGELWFCQGLHTHSNVETPWGIVRMNQAGLWRFRPKLKKLEGFYGSAYEPQNPWGYVFTEWGEPIVIAGNNSSPIYPVPGLTSSHMDLSPTIIWKNGQGRKSSGADIVGTTHFPDDWQGTIITGGYINNAVWALRLLDDGSGFAMEDREPLIKSTSRNFRPVDVKFAPDGSLYICDWYNPIIGHYQASFRDPGRDHVHGRIWRVTAKGRPLTQSPNLAGATTRELLDDLKSSDRWTRQFAKRVLAERPDGEMLSAVSKWIHEMAPGELALKEALGVLQSHEAVSEPLVRLLAMSKDPGARAYAAAAVGRWADRLPAPLEILRPLASDTNARVRLQAVVASTYAPRAESIDIAAAAAAKETDKFIDYALKQAVFALKSEWLPRIPECDKDIALRMLLLNYGGASELLSHVRRVLQSHTLGEQQTRDAWRTLIENGDARDILSVRQIPNQDLAAELLDLAVRSVSARNLPAPADSTPLLEPPLKRYPGTDRLLGLWHVKAARTELVKTVENPPDSSARNRRLSALIGLVGVDLNEAARLANRFHADLSADDWKELFGAFTQRTDGLATLGREFQKSVPSKLTLTTIQRLMNETGRRGPELVQLMSTYLPEHENSSKLTLSDIPALAAEVRSRGEARHGGQVLKRPELGCLNCHAVKGQGGTIGPDLGALGTAQPIEFILGAIIDPQKEVKEGYLATAITTKDGDDYQGYPIRETATEVVLRDILQNNIVTIPKSKIAQKHQSGSPMPSGLADAMTRAEFVDLVRYLSELGR